jgi:hypothetical protein
MESKIILHLDLWQNKMQSNLLSKVCYDTQHNNSQHNDIQHNNK